MREGGGAPWVGDAVGWAVEPHPLRGRGEVALDLHSTASPPHLGLPIAPPQAAVENCEDAPPPLPPHTLPQEVVGKCEDASTPEAAVLSVRMPPSPFRQQWEV